MNLIRYFREGPWEADRSIARSPHCKHTVIRIRTNDPRVRVTQGRGSLNKITHKIITFITIIFNDVTVGRNAGRGGGVNFKYWPVQGTSCNPAADFLFLLSTSWSTSQEHRQFEHNRLLLRLIEFTLHHHPIFRRCMVWFTESCVKPTMKVAYYFIFRWPCISL